MGGTALAGGAVAGAPLVTSAAPSGRDVRALNLALLVEYTEAAFYKEALAEAALQGEIRKLAEQVAAQEREHLALVKKALGDKADPEPDFEFGDATAT